MAPVSDDSTLVELRSVSKRYAMGSAEVRAVHGVSMHIGKSERVVILGKSGCGKSTLLNLIGGLDRPTEGAITVAGRDLSKMPSDELAAYRRDRVGMIFQAYNLVPSRTALANVELPAIFAGRGRAERRAAATRLLAAVGLAGRVNHRPSELSGGEQQRVAIARALINKPDVLLADEPTGNLDSKTAAEIVDLLASTAAERRATLVVVTHDDQLAQRLADRIIHMADGSIAKEPRQGKP
jgi:ABC-type lipoprotein export system ATPase subunit